MLKSLKIVFRPPFRVVTFPALLAAAGFIAYLSYSPGTTIRDGRHDHGTNGIWLQHGWLGDDRWFRTYQRDPGKFRSDLKVRELGESLRENGINYLFPHLCPCRPDGTIPEVDPEQTTRFLNHFQDCKILPWIGGVLHKQCFLESAQWRKNFVSSTLLLLESYPGFAGVQINIEPLPSGNPGFLHLLEELTAAVPDEKIVSVAAYPPPTRWHPFPEVHWEEDYFRMVADRCHLIVPMMYDTSLRFSKVYESLMKSWTHEILTWSGETPVLLGLPAYEDADTGYHHPDVENLKHALRGIHAGLTDFDQPPSNYLGVCLYSEWEMNGHKWETYQREFRKK